VEGSWAHAKKHFRSINGCSLSTFEVHLAEIMWHNHVSCNSGNEYDEFFTLLKRYYPLYEACKLGNCAKLFDTWNTDGAGAGEMITQYCEDADADDDTKLSDQAVLRCHFATSHPPPLSWHSPVSMGNDC